MLCMWTLLLCTVSVVVNVDAELDEWTNDIRQTEGEIVSQWREVSANEQHQLRDKFDEILRPLGFETSLVVIRRANSLALYFICMTLAALLGLRDQWYSHELRDIVKSLFTCLSAGSQTLKRLSWPLSDYEQCLDFFSSLQSKQWSKSWLIVWISSQDTCSSCGVKLFYLGGFVIG